jgi:hypothetical protein
VRRRAVHMDPIASTRRHPNTHTDTHAHPVYRDVEGIDEGLDVRGTGYRGHGALRLLGGARRGVRGVANAFCLQAFPEEPVTY